MHYKLQKLKDYIFNLNCPSVSPNKVMTKTIVWYCDSFILECLILKGVKNISKQMKLIIDL